MSTEPTRSVNEISMFNPLRCGDLIELDGQQGSALWKVGRSSGGWKLHSPANCTWVHPTIKDIDGMAEFIGAVIESAKSFTEI